MIIWVLLCVVGYVLGEVKVSLDSDQLDGTWLLRNQNGSVSTNGRVPGGVYTDLQAAGVLNQSIFYRQNDHEYRWVSRDNWTYSRSFDLPSEVLGKKLINLVVHGVDTVADILLNDQLLGSVDNMFVRYVYPVTSIVKGTNNKLEVRITSAITAAAARAAALPQPVLPNCVPDAYQGECHVNKLRKMQASFSWDWGPAFPSAGLWKSVEIEATDAAIIRDITTFTSKVQVSGRINWLLNVTVYAELATETFDGVIFGSLTSEGKVIKHKSDRPDAITINGNFSYVGTKEFYYEESDVELWWPNGFGEPFLYDLDIFLLPTAPIDQSKKTIQVGFRTVELVQEPVSDHGEGLSFYFKVNDVPIFMKGANWIPGHVLPELGTQSDVILPLLTSAKDAHMNMLRVWGGGVYESDLFYQTADELGLLIWQDMMFASSMYPVTDAFLASSAVETEQQVRRLQHHACVAVWSGNNENEGALVSGYFGTDPEFERYKSEYLKLYIETMMPIVNSLDPSRTYLGSSPSNGDHEKEEGYMSNNTGNPLYGDAHYYNYGSNGWDSATYPDTRFASEYGFQSFSSFESLKSVSVESDWSIESEFSQMRQHHPNGYNEMANQIRQHFPLGEDDGSVEFYQNFIYYSQIVQAMSTKTESEKYRRDRTKLTEDNHGQTMGTLYWQLNDVWQAPTWSSIEFGGRWKMLHYFAKKFFSPILITPEVTPDNQMKLYVVSDLLEDVEVDIDVNVISYYTLKTVAGFSGGATVTNATSELLFSTNFPEYLDSDKCPGFSCFIYSTVRKDGALLSDNVYFNPSFNNVIFPSANVTVTLVDSDSTSATLEITGFAVAPFLWFETASDGVFSDNGFTLVQNQTQITFESRNGQFDLNTFQNTLTMRDLTNVTPRKVFVSDGGDGLEK